MENGHSRISVCCFRYRAGYVSPHWGPAVEISEHARQRTAALWRSGISDLTSLKNYQLCIAGVAEGWEGRAKRR
jgi:hypothetical protein